VTDLKQKRYQVGVFAGFSAIKIGMLRMNAWMRKMMGLAAACGIAAAAHAQADKPIETPSQQRDQFERFNRAMFDFNDGLDRRVLKPVARGYVRVVPQPIRSGTSSFFANLGDGWSGINSLLQGKVQEGGESLARFTLNSGFGILGLIDIASDAGIERHSEDFGQTLARWGVKSGPYVVLPIWGPTTLRDAIVLPIERRGDPVRSIVSDKGQAIVTGLRIVDTRANFLRASDLLDEVALDKYIFVRDGFLQRRNNEVWDGSPPEDAPPK
jgi:phospholipid-binding lipoprotein MlaA